MNSIDCTALRYFFDEYKGDPCLQSLLDRMESANIVSETKSNNHAEKLLEIYREAIPVIEKEMWKDAPGQETIARYQAVYREMEQIISLGGCDNRYEFIVVVPVADRPQQLQTCLSSILDVCNDYHYGGYSKNRFTKVSVIIADDSKEIANRIKNRRLASYLSDQGIDTFYFGIDEQLEELCSLGSGELVKLSGIVGHVDKSAFYHKGPSITRNIAYLKLSGMVRDKKNPLFWFVDSDQEFKIEIGDKDGSIGLSALNYFYKLDRVFSQSKAEILTGKVVGDPPVSPSVMAGNYLEDVIFFMEEMAQKRPGKNCEFHHLQDQVADDAAYHDMADLFGFTPAKDAYQYNCPLQGGHDNESCFKGFVAGLNRFFYGEHPTRRTSYNYAGVEESLKPARTIYTGNYILKPKSLEYFVPFGPLKLRMAGPVLGRIIKYEIGERFVSVNLPLLHRRTVRETGQSEFRPGVNDAGGAVDLSGEMERQYFGDVILFVVEKICALGYPKRAFQREFIEEIVSSTEMEMHEKYSAKHAYIIENVNKLESIVRNDQRWWNRGGGLDSTRGDLKMFMKNLVENFGANAIGSDLIRDMSNRNRRKHEIVDAIMGYADDRQEWRKHCH